jgi:hypothetical protein
VAHVSALSAVKLIHQRKRKRIETMSDLERAMQYSGSQRTTSSETDNLRPGPFVYTPLRNPHGIRVLGKEGDNKYCLTEIKVDPEVDRHQHHISGYQALSYTWGTQIERVSIQLREWPHFNYYSFNITPSLSDALEDFFADKRYKIIWVDAICINQNDLQERDQQVRRMKTIYQHAVKVYIYLGDTPNTVRSSDTVALDVHREDCVNAVKLIKYLCGLLQMFKIDWGVSLASERIFHGVSTDPEITNPTAWNLLRNLFQDAWFERLCKLKTVCLSRDA